MDATGAALVHAVEPYGLIPLFVLGAGVAIVVVLCAFVFPAWRKNLESQQEIERMKAEASIELEREREHRKARESDETNKREIERAKIDSQNVVLMEGMKTSIGAVLANLEHNNALLEGSRTGSSKMGETVNDTNRVVKETHAKVSDIYGILNKRSANRNE